MQRWTIGDVGITRVLESETASKATFLLPDAAPDALRATPTGSSPTSSTSAVGSWPRSTRW
jgi:hypothetical protein